MISGGSTDGDSKRARKSKSRRECMEVEGVRRNEAVVSFGPEDLKGVNLPYNDALVIRARVANYDILRVFVNSGSSVNISFKDALLQMDLQGYQLETVETALFGFAGHAFYPEGEIVLPLTLGTRELKKMVMTIFTVVDAPSSYNIILGRPTMNELRAVASTYHQKIKFSVGSQVGEVWGDQPSSRKCYVEMVRGDQKRARKEGKKVHSSGEMERVVGRREVQFVAEEEHEMVEIGPGKEIRVARDLDLSTRQELTGISPLIVEHHLNILPGSHPVKQKKRHFSPENEKVIDVQVYHLIPLDKKDQDKASFITSGGTFCYVFMPFGLKNAGVTYQRFMNRVFEKQLGRNVEVFVDDILGKSKEVAGSISDLKETFATIMQYGIKLNQAKCIFGVKSGKFLGFLVTDRGIEVNHEKVKSVLNMPPPRSVRDVLRKVQQFGWDEKVERAFQDLKIHLAQLPVLVKPEPGEKLFVYLPNTEYVVSSVLIKEEGSDQKPVYYVSHALRGPELRYSEV
ncbi:uncharacterized protein LOC142530521 [Primulina tabacum]|uniref:uncharacterized protein LOC142530521 n=1 Tax=Primulina tabacum TaxID=48773 RepID=UPI003F5998B4